MAVAEAVRPRRLARLRAGSALLGPAFVAAIAYVDPGNVAANLSAGAPLRLPAGLGARRRERDGRCWSSTCRRSSGWSPASLPEAARASGCGAVGRLAYWVQAELVAAGDRHRRGRRRGHRAEPAVRPAAAARRADHRRRVAGAAGRAEPRAASARSSASITGLLADHRDRLPGRPVRRRRRRRRASSAACVPRSTAPTACCWPPRCSAPP